MSTVTHLPAPQTGTTPPSLMDCAAALTGIGYLPQDVARIAAPLSWSPATISALEAAMTDAIVKATLEASR